MTFAPRHPDGYYDEDGHWQRTKFCFTDCGENCTCSPPSGAFFKPPEETRRPPTDEELREIWRAAGGDFHGPNIEHGSMKEEDLLVFLRQLVEVYSD
jgi:hypothetical protein